MLNKKIASELVIGIIVVAAIAAGTFIYCQSQKEISVLQMNENKVENQKQTKQMFDENIPQQTSEKELKDLVIKAVNENIKTQWDKKVTIDEYSDDKKAAWGKWWAKDAWDWIAWQQEGGQWKIFISLDGFACDKFEKILPEKYNDFFQSVLYMKAANGKVVKNCLKSI